MRNLAALAVAAFAWPAAAQEFTPRAGDVVLDPQAMAAEVVGHTHEFHDGGRSFFSISGTYTYTYPDGGVAYGSYEVRPGGIVCTAFTHGFTRCDMYVQASGRLVLIDESGTRFPVREIL